MSRLSRILIVAVACVAPLFGPPAIADEYPSRPIRLIMPIGAGGSADALGRPFAEKLKVLLKQPIVIENRPGAQMSIGASYVAKSPPDGYTLLFMPGGQVLAPRLVSNLSYDPINDFTPITVVGRFGYVLASNPAQPFKTLPELIAYAHDHPGIVTIAVSDPVTRVGAELLRKDLALNLVIVPFKGGGEVATALLGNHVATALLFPGVFDPFQKDRRMTALAVTTASRLSALPDVPTVAESAKLPDYDLGSWFLLAGPAHLPNAVVDKLHHDAAQVLSDPAMINIIRSEFFEPVADATPQAARRTMHDYAFKMGKLFDETGVGPQ
ncbi:MAG TPA: tripartite tricarboxylate transporter substrate binding protein [Pseudolabrys sp.]|nr:tripartite tricarboxylate transporter substrate binding protein [Pseudolabrys sp.]